MDNNENFYAWLTGWLSIICWIIVFTPQIYQNYKSKNGESLSLAFLWIWLLGDLFNIAGVVLENLMPTMLFLAIYYTLADVILILQVFYYRIYNKRTNLSSEYQRLLNDARNERTLQEGGWRERPIQPVQAVTAEDIEITASTETSRKYNVYFVSTLCFAFFITTSFLAIWYLGVPQYLGWCSALLYIGSRIPQISKNHRNRSTDGLSIYMFAFSILGNALYCASILIQSMDMDENARKDYLLQNTPWLVGSGGTLLLDMFIGTQFIVFVGTEIE